MHELRLATGPASLDGLAGDSGCSALSRMRRGCEIPAPARLRNKTLIVQLVEELGVGRWTVEMFLMFTLGRPDVLPVDDYGIRLGYKMAYAKRTLPKPKALARYGELRAPYRTTASWYLWRAVDIDREKKKQATQEEQNRTRLK